MDEHNESILGLSEEENFQNVDIDVVAAELGKAAESVREYFPSLEGKKNYCVLKCTQALAAELEYMKEGARGPVDHLGWRVRNIFEIMLKLLNFIELGTTKEELDNHAEMEYLKNTAEIIRNIQFCKNGKSLRVEFINTPRENRMLNAAADDILRYGKKVRRLRVDIGGGDTKRGFVERHGLTKEYDSMYRLTCKYAHISSMKLVNDDSRFEKVSRVSMLETALLYTEEIQNIIGEYKKAGA